MPICRRSYAAVTMTVSACGVFAIVACEAPTLPIPPPDRDPVDAAAPSAETAPDDAQVTEIEFIDGGAPIDAEVHLDSTSPLGSPNNTATGVAGPR